MNILFLSLFPIEPGAGGIQRVTDILAKEFVRRGHKVIFLSVQYDLIINGKIETAPQYYIYVNKDKDWEFKIEKLISDNKITHVINQVPTSITNKVLNSISQDIVKISVCHQQPFNTDNISRRQILAADTSNFKQLLFKYVSYLFPKIREIIFGRIERRQILETLSVSDKLCFISELFYPRLIKHIPNVDKSKLCAINNPNSYSPQSDILEKENLVIWVGRVENSSKNTIDFVKIWNLIYKDNPSWKAIIAGDGKDLVSVEQYIRKNKIENIELIGQCNNIPNLYNRAKFNVVTSYSESWCMVLVEGLAYGCVPCAYDTYETVHEIIQGGNGIITKPAPWEMAKQLAYLMNNEDEYEKIAKKTRASINKYRVELIVNKWECLLKSL